MLRAYYSYHTHILYFVLPDLINSTPNTPAVFTAKYLVFKYANKRLNTCLLVFPIMHFLSANITFAAMTSVFFPFLDGKHNRPWEDAMWLSNKVPTISSCESLHFTGSTWLQQICCQSAHVTLPLFHDHTIFNIGCGEFGELYSGTWMIFFT